jgi:hypothetical protein
VGKRFTDTEKWCKAWFRKLSLAHKAAWTYLCDRCDSAGIMSLDSELAEFQIGAATDWDAFIDLSEGRIERISNGKLWLTGFVDFQYGQLSPESKPHREVIRRLESNGLLSRVMEGYPRGINTPKEKDQDQEQDSERKGDSKGGKRFAPPTIDEVAVYCQERGNKVNPKKFVDFYASKGWKVGKNSMKDWKACVRTWEEEDAKKGSCKPATGTAHAPTDSLFTG